MRQPLFGCQLNRLRKRSLRERYSGAQALRSPTDFAVGVGGHAYYFHEGSVEASLCYEAAFKGYVYHFIVGGYEQIFGIVYPE